MSRELARYLATRFGQLLLIVFVAVSINFIIPRMLPGDPVQTALARLQASGGNQNVDIQAISAAYRAKYGLDAPIFEQYINYWVDLFRLDLGVSFANFPEKVSTMIGNAMPWSVTLLAVATLIAFVTGSLLGARMAWPTAGRGIKAIVPLMMVLTSIPFYLLAIILIYFFAVVLKWFPPAGGVDTTRIMRFDWATTEDILRHAFLPALAIILGNIGFWALGMRSQMVNVLGEDYITFAEAKGLHPRRIFVWYGMRNALLAQVTALALSLGSVVSGAVLVEVIFNYPGLGSLLYNAIRGQDYFVIQGVVLMLIVSLAVLLFLVDLIYPLLDPQDPAMTRFFASIRRNYEQGRISGMLLLGLAILLAIVLFGAIGPFFVDATNAQVGAVRPRKPPGPDYFLGTDSQGRDMWTLLIYATPNTLKMGLIAGFIGVGVGTVLGLIAGQFRGWIDTVIRVISDALLTVPAIAILVIIAGNIDRMSTWVMALVVASLGWMFTTRTVRAQVLTIREKSYIEVARVNGEGPWEILFTEVMPNLMPYIVASFVGTVSGSILAVIGLEALGLGALEEMTLGNTIYWSQQSSAVLRGYWWWWGPPIVVIALIFIGLFLTSVGFDRFANPKLARR